MTGTVAAQTAVSPALDTPAVDGWCPLEVMDHLSALDAPAFRMAPTTERWPSIVPPIAGMRRSAPALAFSTDPFGGDPVEVTLSGLVGDGLHLDGEYVRAGSDRLDGAGLLTFEANGDFRFQADTTNVIDCMTDVSRCARFDAVNVYHHVDSYVRDFWVAELGVAPTFVAEARVHVVGDGGFAHWPTRSLKLGVGSIFMKNSALSDDLIYHEYNHLMMASLGFEIGNGAAEQTRALHEAYADYFMATWTDDPRVGEWVVTCPPRQQCTGPKNDTDLRTLNLNPEGWNWREGQPADTLKYGFCLRFHEGDLKCKASWNNFTNPYVWGMMWAASLWDLRTAVGAEVADAIALEAVRMHTASTEFETAFEHILTVGMDEFGSNVADQVRLAFEQRGFVLAVGVANENRDAGANNAPRLEVWPNPVRDVLNIQSRETRDVRHLRWVIHDVTGRIVLEGQAGTTGSWSIRTHQLAPGLYLLRVGVHPSSRAVLFHKMH